MVDSTSKSVLAVDFGSVTTRVVLVDTVEGEYRLVARGAGRTTDGYPVSDITVGFDRVLRQIADVTGRQFMDEAGKIITPVRSDGSGIDIFAVTASIGRPLRAVVVGLVPEVSVSSAIRAASGTYIAIEDTVHLEDGRNEEERLNAILLTHPDVVIITGGTEQGAETAIKQLAQIARLAISLIDKTRRPVVVYTGNSRLQPFMQALFDGSGSDVFFAENVRPNMDEEHYDSARQQLGEAFDRYKEQRGQGFGVIGPMSQTGVLPTGQSYAVLAEYFAETQSGGTALVDVGSSSSTLAIAMDGHITTSIRTDIGLGHSAPTLLESVGLDAVRQWLPFNITAGALLNYVLNKSLRPATLPATLHDLYLEHALLKTGVWNLVVRASKEWDTPHLPLSRIIGAGAAFTRTGHPAYDALLLIDAFQPIGATLLQTDPHGMVAALGAIARLNPEAVVQLLGHGCFTTLGTCVSLSGIPRRDKTAMTVRIVEEGSKDVYQQTIQGGHLWVYPLPPGRTAQVTVKCAGNASVNGKRRVKWTLSGGSVGLIFDARGRSVILPKDVEGRADLLPLWISEMTGDPVRAVEAGLMGIPDLLGEEDEAPERESRRRRPKTARQRRLFGGRRKAEEVDEDVSGDEALDALLDEDKDEMDELDELRNVLS